MISKRFSQTWLIWTLVEQPGVTLLAHSLMPPAPPPPPPPYTLHAFNIELTPIEWPQAQAKEVRLWSTKSDVICRRTPPKDTQQNILKNFLRLAAQSEDVPRDVQEPRISEILEDSREEDDNEEGEGAPLPRGP